MHEGFLDKLYRQFKLQKQKSSKSGGDLHIREAFNKNKEYIELAGDELCQVKHSLS